MIVLHAWDPLCEEPEIGLLAGQATGRECVLGTFWGAPVAGAGREGGAIPVMGAFGGPLRRTARSACPDFLWTYVVSEICRTFCARHLPTMMVDMVRASYARHQTCQE